MSLFNFGRKDIGIDLGTSSVLIYIRGKGVVLKEPSVVAVDKQTGRVLDVGDNAESMLGRTPDNIVTVHPLHDGVISNFNDTERMLRHFLNKVMGKRSFFKPHVVACVPSGVTEVEKRSVIDVIKEAGAGHAFLIEEPVAAAIGAGIDIGLPNGNMILDIGGGTADIAVISLGEAVISESIKVAGNVFDEHIIKYLKEKYHLLIGERTAEKIKMTIGSAVSRENEVSMEITGRDLILGLPRKITISSSETTEALQIPLSQIIASVCSVLERTPPELSSDVLANGILMTGGGSLLYGLDKLVTERTQIPCRVAADAVSCVAIGTGMALESISQFTDRAVQNHSRNAYDTTNE